MIRIPSVVMYSDVVIWIPSTIVQVTKLRKDF